ncbi:MAG: hypothetical protein R6X05_12955, partial [Desulfobacterales bacterium]
RWLATKTKTPPPQTQGSNLKKMAKNDEIRGIFEVMLIDETAQSLGVTPLLKEESERSRSPIASAAGP